MKEILANKNLIAYCGLYCGACKKYLSDKCPGCGKNEKASWCNARKCCIEHNYKSCADCTIKPIDDCKEFNSFMAKIFSFIFQSDRKACVAKIKNLGYDKYANEMTSNKIMTIKR